MKTRAGNTSPTVNGAAATAPSPHARYDEAMPVTSTADQRSESRRHGRGRVETIYATLVALLAIACTQPEPPTDTSTSTTGDEVQPAQDIGAPAPPANTATSTTGYTAITAGWEHSCALHINGTITCWGTWTPISFH